MPEGENPLGHRPQLWEGGHPAEIRRGGEPEAHLGAPANTGLDRRVAAAVVVLKLNTECTYVLGTEDGREWVEWTGLVAWWAFS